PLSAALPLGDRGLRLCGLRPGPLDQPLRGQGGDPGARRPPRLLLPQPDALCLGPAALLFPEAARTDRPAARPSALAAPRVGRRELPASRPFLRQLPLRGRAPPALLGPRRRGPGAADRPRRVPALPRFYA